MAFYQQSESNTLKVDFGDKGSITLKLRGSDLDVVTLRMLSEESTDSDLVRTRIARLESEAKDAASTADFDRLMKEVQQLRTRPDKFSFMVSYVFGAASGWTDYYPDEEAERRGELVPFNKENVSKMGGVALGKIVEALNAHFGFDKAQPEEKKEELKSLPSHSLSEADYQVIS